ncbi:MAG: hypothetical protein L6Q33_00970 [Bacteriovoracaceae bacterium]|nr:hypothetical protein [Bacteriovoracaceae bacterium]
MKITVKFVFIFLCLILSTAARTRKPIPAGRFEALTGIKVSSASNANEIRERNTDSLWVKYSELLRPDFKVYLAPSFTNVVFPAQLNISLTNEKSAIQSMDSLILSELKSDQDWLIKMLKKEGIVFLKTETSLKDVQARAELMDLVVLYFSIDTGEVILKKVK